MVFEKSVVGYVSYMSSYMYFDKDGIIVESSVEQLPGVPWITGLDFGHIILHQPLPVADPDTFGEILNLTQVLSVHEVKVDKVDYHSSMAGAGEIRLHIGDVVVELGDSEDLDGKVTELPHPSGAFRALPAPCIWIPMTKPTVRPHIPSKRNKVCENNS